MREGVVAHSTLLALLLAAFYSGYLYGRLVERHRQRQQA